MRPALAALFAFGLLACDAFVSQAPATTCAEAGTQCRLPEGPLGVCERSTCPSGEAPPCFSCTPQH